METNAQIHIQAATFQDESLLWIMLTYAAWMESGGEEQIPQA
jgi:hypothetical protein